VTPGSGFGKCGQGHIRISAFNSRDKVEAAMASIAASSGGLRSSS
jgi:LL-diaminopimelate aminotransferase